MKKYIILIFVIFIGVGCSLPKNLYNNNNQQLKKEKQKVSIEHSDFLTQNALHDAVRANDLALVKFLVSQKISINQRDQYGFTPLHLAVRLHNLKIVNYLIKQGANINTLDAYKDTPLLDATRNNDTNIAKALICNGAYRNVSDMYGMSTLNHSSRNNNEYISKLLRTDNLKKDCSEPQPIKETTKEVIPPVVKETAPAQIEQPTIDDLPDLEEPTKTTEPQPQTISNGLYEALFNEFKDDLTSWNAILDKETLTFKFQNPALLFAKGSGKLNDKFKDILATFLPRYANILSEYKDEIEQVTIEGHTSSEYGIAKTDAEKFRLNQILSEKRANAVYKYAKSITVDDIENNLVWLDDILKPIGKSSSNLILNDDGTENKELSRRVEFNIIQKTTN